MFKKKLPALPFAPGSIAIHLRTGKKVMIKSVMLGYIQYECESLQGDVRQDCWHESLKPI